MGFDSKLVRLKARIREMILHYQSKFRFQTGSIKSVLHPFGACILTSFDSKLVRLKEKPCFVVKTHVF